MTRCIQFYLRLSAGYATLQEDILRCLYSISDNNAFLLFNRDPVDRMIEYLRTHFQCAPLLSSRPFCSAS